MEKSSLNASKQAEQILAQELERFKETHALSLSTSKGLASSNHPTKRVDAQVKAIENNLLNATSQKNSYVAEAKILTATALLMNLENGDALNNNQKKEFSNAIEHLSHISNKENISESDIKVSQKIVGNLAESLSSSPSLMKSYDPLSQSNQTVVTQLEMAGLIGPIKRMDKDIKSPTSTHASRVRIVAQKDGGIRVVKSYREEAQYNKEKKNFNSPEYKDIVDFINKKLHQHQQKKLPNTMPYYGHAEIPLSNTIEYEAVYGAVNGNSLEDIEKSIEKNQYPDEKIKGIFQNIGLQMGALDFIFYEERKTQLIHADPNMGNFFYDEDANQLYWIDNDDMYERPISAHHFKNRQKICEDILDYYKEKSFYKMQSIKHIIDKTLSEINQMKEEKDHDKDIFKELLEKLFNDISKEKIEMEEDDKPLQLYKEGLEASSLTPQKNFELSENYGDLVKKLRDLAIKPRKDGHRELEGEAHYITIQSLASDANIASEKKRKKISEIVKFIKYRLLALRSIYQGYLDALKNIQSARDIILKDYINLQKEEVPIPIKSGHKINYQNESLIQTVGKINTILKELNIDPIVLQKYNLKIEDNIVSLPSIQKQKLKNLPLPESVEVEEVTQLPTLPKRTLKKPPSSENIEEEVIQVPTLKRKT